MEEVVLDLDSIRAVRVMGRGAMGTVFLARLRLTPTPDPAQSLLPPLFALKVVDKRCASAKPHALRRARWELSLLSRLSSARHPFLPSLLASLETPDLLAWALPFCPGGDLHALRRSLSPDAFSPAAIRFYLSEIVAALAHLHSLRIAYRDLKPENVLLQSSGHITLTDFDLSRHLPAMSSSPPSPPPPPPPPPLPSDRHRRQYRRNLTRIFSFGTAEDHLQKKARSARVSPVSRRRTSSSSLCHSGGGGDERSFSFVGTEEYVAPEVVRGDGHGLAVDWWALGVLAYELAYGRTPFRGRNRKETFGNVLTRPPVFPGRRRTDLTDLIERLLAKDPARRLGYAGGAEEVKAHPFFEGVRWEMLPEVSRPPFLAPAVDEEEQEVMRPGGDGRVVVFDVRDYFKGLHQQQQAASPSVSSESLAEF